MIKKYTVLRSLFGYAILLIISIIMEKCIIKDFNFAILLLCTFIFSIGIFIRCKHYKIQIFDDKIVFYELFKKEREFSYDIISKIYISDIEIPNKFLGIQRYINIYTRNEEYVFNIYELENEQFYKDIYEISKKYDIEYLCDEEK